MRYNLIFWSFFILLLLLSPFRSHAQSGGYWQSLLPQGYSLSKVQFLDTTNVIAVGDFGTVILSTDAGLTWSVQQSGTSLDLYSLAFFDPHNGTVVGDSAIILQTTDGGITWSSVFGQYLGKLWDVAYIDQNTITSVGRNNNVTTRAIIVRTTDTGQTWSVQFLSDPYDISGISIIDRDNQFMIGLETLLHTTDAGNSWSSVSTVPVNLRAIQFVSPDVGFIGGYRYDKVYDVILRTTDGGNSWDEKNVDTTGAYVIISSISFADVNNGFVVTQNGGIFHTSDGGLTWMRQSAAVQIPSGQLGISCRDSSVAIIVGPGGLILRTTDAGATWSLLTDVKDDIRRSIPEQVMLSQNYPNPFNPVTEIRFTVQSVRYTWLKVYDILGREVATLVNEVKQPGEYTVSWNAINAPSGTYFYRLQSGSFIMTKNLVLLK